MLKKIPVDLYRNMCRAHGHGEWSLDELRQSLLFEIEILETCVPLGNLEVKEVKLAEKNVGTITSLHAQAKPGYHKNKATPNCVFCKGSHVSSQCTTVSDVYKRSDIVKQNNLCWNCLGKHRISNCKSTGRFRHCMKRHHSSLCFANSQSNSGNTDSGSSSSSNASTITDPAVSTTSRHTSKVSNNVVPKPATNGATVVQSVAVNTVPVIDTSPRSTCNTVLLKTAVTDVQNREKCITSPCNILFDDGSQRTFITSQSATTLGLTPYSRETLEFFLIQKNLYLNKNRHYIHNCNLLRSRRH